MVQLWNLKVRPAFSDLFSMADGLFTGLLVPADSLSNELRSTAILVSSLISS